MKPNHVPGFLMTHSALAVVLAGSSAHGLSISATARRS